MANLQTDPEIIIQRLGSQIGHLTAELAKRDTQLEVALTRIDELDTQLAEASASTLDSAGGDA